MTVIAAALSFGGSESAAQSTSQLDLRPSTSEKKIETAQLPSAALSLEETRSVEKTPDDSPRNPTAAESTATTQPQFRVERMPIAGGAELITIFGRLDGMRAAGSPAPEVPLISVVRDSLGDDKPENDRLRYLWMLTYTRPTLGKRVLSAVPFLYQHVGNKMRASNNAPTPIIDLANTKQQTWNNFFRSDCKTSCSTVTAFLLRQPRAAIVKTPPTIAPRT